MAEEPVESAKQQPSFDGFFEHLLENHFKKSDLEKEGLSDQYDDLLDLLNNQSFKELLEKEWHTQQGSEWQAEDDETKALREFLAKYKREGDERARNPEVITRETIVNCLTEIMTVFDSDISESEPTEVWEEAQDLSKKFTNEQVEQFGVLLSYFRKNILPVG